MATRQLQSPPRRSGPRLQAVLLASALALCSMPALAQVPGDRLSDKSMKMLIDQVDEGRDKFEGNLDGAFKGSTVRGRHGETKVSAALQDYQDSTKKLQNRFTPDYPAGPEAATVLKQSTAIDEFMKSQPSTMKGRREWERQVENLKLLAAAYGTTFPLPDGATVRRMNDKELVAAATSIAAAADRLKSAFDKDKSLAKPDKTAAKKDAEALAKQANTVRDRIRDGKPAAGDLRLLLEHAARIEAFVGAHDIPAATAPWQAVQGSLGRLQAAFGLANEPS